MKKFLPVVFLCWCCSCVDEGDIKIDNIGKWTFVTTSDGLPGNLITTLYTDSKRNVWIGTTNGLSKYDGTSFTNYSETNGPLTDNWILAILEDRDDNIIVGTQNGLNLFDGETWFYFPLFEDIEVNALVEATNGDIWVGTSGYGVIQLYYAGDFEQHFDGSCGVCNYVQSLYKHDDGTLWIGSEGDLKVYDGTFESFTEADGLAGPWVSAIGSDHWGNIWLGGFAEATIARYINSDFEQLPLVETSAFNWVRAIMEDRNGLLWIAADGGGLLYYDGASMRQVIDVFEDEYVTAITVDRNGELWVGTEGAGIATYFPPQK
jgi:ligand-binding sensor domain-containing protein